MRGVLTDPERLTALVLLGIRDQERFPLIFYRENCADMALCEDDVDEALIADSRPVLATGTQERVLGTLQALSLAGGKRPDTSALLAAIATAWALDITPELIGAGIKTFEYQA